MGASPGGWRGGFSNRPTSQGVFEKNLNLTLPQFFAKLLLMDGWGGSTNFQSENPEAVPVPKHSLNEPSLRTTDLGLKTKDLTKVISDASFTSDMLIFV